MKNETKRMKCLNPTDCWICGTTTCKDGIVSPHLVFSWNAARDYYSKIAGDNVLLLTKLMDQNHSSQPCGKCAACQIRKRKDFAVRLCHESMMHEQACFITLTYDDKSVPTTDWNLLFIKRKQFDRGVGSLPEMTLLPSDVQKFIKRLRRHLEYVPKNVKYKRDHATHIRYFAVGEYGSKTHRPHYHIIVYGWYPSDADYFFSRNGHDVFRSKQIEKLWKFGFSSLTPVYPQVAKYCARYVTKKFARLTENTDLSVKAVVPEFTLQSTRNGGIGSPWLEKFGEYLCNGFVNVRTSIDRISKCSIPRYYYDRLRKINLPLWLNLRDQRISFIKAHPDQYDAESYNALVRFVECTHLADKRLADLESF